MCSHILVIYLSHILKFESYLVLCAVNISESSQQITQLQTEGPVLETRLVKDRHVRKWHLLHIKSAVCVIFSKFSFKLYIWKYQSGVFPSSPWRIKIVTACLWIDHPSG